MVQGIPIIFIYVFYIIIYMYKKSWTMAIATKKVVNNQTKQAMKNKVCSWCMVKVRDYWVTK